MGQAAAPSPPAPAVPPRFRTSRRRLLADRAGRFVVTGGGLGIIACILAILIFIVVEVWPLTTRADVVPGRALPLPFSAASDPLLDEYRTVALLLATDGTAVAVPLDGSTPATLAPLPLDPPAALLPGGLATAGGALAAATADGRVVAVPGAFETRFDGDVRTIVPEVGEPAVLALDPSGAPLGTWTARLGEEGAAAAAQLADGTVAVVWQSVEENAMTGERSVTEQRAVTTAPARLTAMALAGDGSALYAGTERGDLVRWTLASGVPSHPEVVQAGPSPVTALALLLGDRSLLVGQGDGGLSVWFPVRAGGTGSERLTRIRTFPRHAAAVRKIAPSPRDKGFLVMDGGGTLGLYHSTSERVLWRGRSPLPHAVALGYAPKGDGALLTRGDRLQPLAIENPHPEASWKTFFGKVWYEGYDRPQWSWQSTGGTDDFEPKLSLTPLVVGTLKGTVYSLLLAIPLGVLGAMYASQFMHPNLLRIVKPAVEIMAALPSVVLGFLAGLWLAPRLEQVFPALLLIVLAAPLAVLLAGWAWRALPMSVRGRFPTGSELFVYLGAVTLAIWGCLALEPAFEAAVFGESFQAWLRERWDVPYDQRNAVVVALAMGFAVIPIIFAIAEDAFSNVPRTLISGSLALGANRWQTVTRVVLPTASAGIFSAVMIGFGRAIGETMIVLMATGNTPIMSWNPFDGFRTLSANIAVEIPEAPHGSTLYRTLFLAALLLFAVTFVINTLAELVRQRLRRRYASL